MYSDTDFLSSWRFLRVTFWSCKKKKKDKKKKKKIFLENIFHLHRLSYPYLFYVREFFPSRRVAPFFTTLDYTRVAVYTFPNHNTIPTTSSYLWFLLPSFLFSRHFIIGLPSLDASCREGKDETRGLVSSILSLRFSPSIVIFSVFFLPRDFPWPKAVGSTSLW